MEGAPPADDKALARRRRHLEMLLLVVGAIVLAPLLEVRPDQRVALRGLPYFPMPETCVAWAVFGVRCPACGLTRSFIYLARGDWSSSLKVHRLGWLLALVVLVQVPYRLLALKYGAGSEAAGVSRWFGWVLILLLIGNWVFNMIYPGGP